VVLTVKDGSFKNEKQIGVELSFQSLCSRYLRIHECLPPVLFLLSISKAIFPSRFVSISFLRCNCSRAVVF